MTDERTFTVELPGGATYSILRSLRDKTTSLSAKVDWKGKDRVEFTCQASGSSLEELFLKIKLVYPEALIKERKQGQEVAVSEWPAGRWIEKMISCPNKNCVSAQPREPSNPKLKIVSWNPVNLQCNYCGRYIDHATIIGQLS
ncbi:MAG: hypothetical protein ACRECH_12475 [Nitrososphaerales archaeon]